MPAIAKSANIFLRASGPAFFQRSTHVSTHFASSSLSSSFSSLTFNQATSSSSASRPASDEVPGGGAAPEFGGAGEVAEVTAMAAAAVGGRVTRGEVSVSVIAATEAAVANETL